MASCANCGSTILFGGVREQDRRYCNAGCRQQHVVVTMSATVSDDDVEREVARAFDGPCPRCQGPGPVDLHISHRVWSALVLTQWRPHVVLGCARCGQRSKLVSLLFCAGLGWWGAPYGILMTPVMLVRNVLALAKGSRPTQPSDALRRAVRVELAQQHAMEQAVVAGAQAMIPARGSAPRGDPGQLN